MARKDRRKNGGCCFTLGCLRTCLWMFCALAQTILLAEEFATGNLRALQTSNMLSSFSVSLPTMGEAEAAPWAVLDCATASTVTSSQDSSLLASSTIPGFQIVTHNPKEDCPISADIHRDGCYECHILYPLLRAMRQNSPKVTAILDIGANIGLYGLTAAAADPSVRAYMVEPFALNHDKICASLRRNADLFGDRVRVFNVAAVEAHAPSTVLRLHGSHDLNKGGIRLVESTKEMDNADTSGVEGIDYARTTSISSLRDQLPPAGSTIVLKVDVEGSECNALHGALEYLQTVDIAYCAIEWSQERLGACRGRQDIFDLFAANGLRPYQAVLNQTTHPVGWEELDPNRWESWIWNAPNRKRPERALFDVAWSKTKPKFEGPIVPKISPKRERCG